jgi:hypothetical protein
MSRRPRLTGAARVAERRRENLDMFLGLLGFFTALIFVSTVVGELRGEPSLAPAVTLAVFVVLVAVTLKIRRGLQQQVARAVESQTSTSA